MRGCNPGTPFSHLPLHSCLAWRGAGEAFAAEHARGVAHERRRRALQVWRIDGAHLGKHGEQVSKTLYGVSKTLLESTWMYIASIRHLVTAKLEQPTRNKPCSCTSLLE